MTILGAIIAQLDKVILSRVITLDLYGYYVLASTIASSLYYLATPVFSVFFPTFTQLISTNDTNGLKRTYHLGSQLMSSLILPCALLVVFFSSELIFLWTQSSETVKNTLR